jgi:integrase
MRLVAIPDNIGGIGCMATYKIRGGSHYVIFPYKTETGETKQQWEAYTTELEAITRQAVIGYLQKTKDDVGLQTAVNEYKQTKLLAKLKRETAVDDGELDKLAPKSTSNMHRTYKEFALKWLPFHARKKRFSPTTYDSYLSNLENHILPFFGDRIMSEISFKDIDDFIDYLSKKPCKGPKSYNKKPKDVPTLSSGSVKRTYNVFSSGLETAKRWGFIKEIPRSPAPSEKTKKRKAWEFQKVSATLDAIDDTILHLAVHLAFVCSLRAGETAGIDVSSIDFRDRSFWITQEVQRVSDKSLMDLPQNEIIRVFPKEVSTSKSNLVLKPPKTDGSYRKQYLTTPLLQEIKQRIREINEYKEFFGSEYRDYGLLICKPDGRPYDPHSFVKPFKRYQTQLGIAEDEQIEFQGLRKSGQMHKVRLSQNNYQLVAESGGQSPEVLMSNYNEALESEKRTLSMLVETSFYAPVAINTERAPQTGDKSRVMDALLNNPEFAQQIMQLLQVGADIM